MINLINEEDDLIDIPIHFIDERKQGSCKQDNLTEVEIDLTEVELKLKNIESNLQKRQAYHSINPIKFIFFE